MTWKKWKFLYLLIMHMTIKKWGNSLATRIPKAVVESIDLHIDQEVDIEAINGKIVITPIKEKKQKGKRPALTDS